jgi:hypothetical protein
MCHRIANATHIILWYLLDLKKRALDSFQSMKRLSLSRAGM